MMAKAILKDVSGRKTAGNDAALRRANDISDRMKRKLTQLKGICAAIGGVDLTLEIFVTDDLQAAMWGVQDLIEDI
jgi:hypothetical protein